MEEQRKHSSKWKKAYKEINKQIKEAKEQWPQNECREIETLEEKHNTFKRHRKIKIMTGGTNSNSSDLVLNNQGSRITDNERMV